jgi:RNA polymerase sigma-70 factor (ECF subfamily)
VEAEALAITEVGGLRPARDRHELARAEALRAEALRAQEHLLVSLDFDGVYAQHVGFVWRVLRGMGVPDAGVEDAVQDVFIVVHRRLPEFDGRHALRTWLFAIAYRVACDHRRKQRRSSMHESLGMPGQDTNDEQELVDAAPSPAETAEQSQQLERLSDALDALDDDKRALLVLAEIEQMTVPEMAEITGTPLNTVYTRLRRARIELQDVLSKGLAKSLSKQRGSR